MSKESVALNYLVSLAVVGNKENNRGKIFTSEEIILQALKRNEPMKVANRTETEEGHYEVEEQGYISGRHYLITITSGECPVCGELMDDRENIVSPIFCPKCGQRLDWSREK